LPRGPPPLACDTDTPSSAIGAASRWGLTAGSARPPPGGRSTEEGEGDEERREKSGGARRGTIVFSQGTKRFWDGKRDERPNKEQSFTQCQIGEEIFLGTKEGTRKFYGVK
jgi:hypothetical protein